MSSKSARSQNGTSPILTRRWSISRRLTVLYVATTAILLVVAAAYLYWSQVKNLEREDNDFLATKIEDCRRLLQERPNDDRLLVNEVQTEPAASIIKYYERVLDSRGRVVLETPGMTVLLPVASFPVAKESTKIPSRGKVWKAATGETCLLITAKATVAPEGARPRIVQVALDISAEEALLTGYRRKLMAVVVLGASFAWVMGAFVTRRGLQPLKDIAKATEHITASQLHERIIAKDWPHELASLAHSFDQMLDRLEDSFTRLSQFSADLAHELRTPINNLRGEAGVALSKTRTPEQYRRVLESSLEEFARLSRLIDNLLFLARADSPITGVERSSFDARKAIGAVAEFYEALADDKGVGICCQGEGSVNADPTLFRRAVSNLLSNALNHTARDGQVDMKIIQCADRGVEVVVSDTGCGIPREHLPRIFDRLYRADSARAGHPNGAGLGLAIVKSIMTLHGGTVEVRSEVGKGSSFTLRFPLDDPAART
jgi:two-component system heavy metal sensor histidine kinase CusS